MELIKYDAACRAVAEAKTLTDVKDIKNICEAARAYAKMARNRQMEIDAVEIRVRAERKEGELLTELKKSGVGVQGNQVAGAPRITLKDIGIDNNTSAIAQRLALLPEQRFESELRNWRSSAETAVRLETPLQAYRQPSVHADRERVKARNRRLIIDAGPLEKFRGVDGRRVSDWRCGELRRIADLSRRMMLCAEALIAGMPVANADPLATVEMVYRQQPLLALLESIWESPVDCGDAGLNQTRIDESRRRRTRKCENENCGKEFVARNPSGQARAGKSNEGRFCSRKCAHEAPRKPKH